MWLDTWVQFGGVAGCGIFGCPADLWKKIVVHLFNLEGAFRWVDNNLLLKEASNPTTIKDVISLSESMGVATNFEKIKEFGDKQKYIGFVWNTRIGRSAFRSRSLNNGRRRSDVS